MVAAVKRVAARRTYCAPSRVVMCSNTIFSSREVAPQRDQHAVDEHRLAVEQVDLGIGHLAVHQQQQAVALHRFERRVGLAHVGHAGIAVGGRAGRVELDRARRRLRSARRDLVGRQAGR